MDLKKRNQWFPIGNSVQKGNIITLIVVCAIYLVAAWAVRFVVSVFGFLPLIGWILRLLSWGFGVYCAVGIVLAILEFFRN